MTDEKLNIIKRKLKDQRSNKVIFVSHCILNENTRYFGGAFRKGAMREVLTKLHDQGIGIVQMKCPEQQAWGGVQKSFMWKIVGAKKRLIYKFRSIIVPVFIRYTINKYRRLARDVLHDIVDYQNAGFEIVGLVGVDGSPSCGILRKLRMNCSFEVLADLSMETLNITALNDQLYSWCLDEGAGMFIDELKRQLDRKNILIKFYSVDIVKEMQGGKQDIDLSADHSRVRDSR